MTRLVKLLVAGAVAGVLSGCATYDYGYSQPYYGYAYPYSYGPYYYDYGPAYYGPGYYGAPFVGFDFRFHDRDRRDRRHAGNRDRDGHARDGDRRRSQLGAVRPAPTRQQQQAVPSSRGPRIAPAPPARRDTNQAARARARSSHTAELRADQR